MGTKGREIVGMDVGALLDMLNRAYADEWLAYYQYWLGAKVAKGPMKDAVMAELTQHAADELRHADMLALRIIQLGGTPALTPADWLKLSGCGYDAPADPYVSKLLDQNISGEQCAIVTYKKLIEATQVADPVTYNLAVQILSDEVEHEEDLQALKEDLELLIARQGR
ncbi:MAG: ferritin-like domain-containing protein [Kiritimatiellae bacterium]|nr:ferritin-like domain-containing protein [Kiritimatiellia bacterium]